MSPSRPTFYRRKGRPRRRQRSRKGLFVGLAALGAILFVLIGGETGWWAVRGQQARVDTLESRIAAVRAETDALKEAAEEVQVPGSERLEKVAREQYLMSRPGERVLHVLDETAPPQPTADGSKP